MALAKTLQKIEETSARLKIISILSNYFRSVIALNKEDLLPSLYLCLNQLGPAYEAQELGIADTYLMKVCHKFFISYNFVIILSNLKV